MKDYVRRIKYGLDDVNERIERYVFDLSNGYPIVGKYIDAEEKYHDEFIRAYDRLRKTPHPSRD